MTHHDELFDPVDPRDEEAAAWLDRRFGLPAPDDDRITAAEREAIRARVLGNPASSPRATGIIAGPRAAFPAGVPPRVHRFASLSAAAALVLIVVATLGAYLRSDTGEQLPGAAATASVLPFAPGAALASPAAATCPTDASLVLNLDSEVDTRALAALPFPVVWNRNGMLTVQRGDDVLREIDVPEEAFLWPTGQPNVILASLTAPEHRDEPGMLVNIANGDTIDIGPVGTLAPTGGRYLFWASDRSFTRWSVTDLRDFQTVDLSERFRPEPLAPWRPFAGPLTTSADGSVMLVGTTSSNPSNETPTAPTPFPEALPSLNISRNAILIDGSLDDIRLVGPLATSSGATALSPDASMVAWVGPNSRPGLRFLEIQDVATGEEVSGRPVDATYSVSLLFSADGEFLYVTQGTSLERIDLDLANGFSLGYSPIELPDTGYRIVGASPDRTKVMLDQAGSSSEETAMWVDLDTGEVRELPGQPSRLFTDGIPGISPPVSRYVQIDDLQETVSVVDMTTGEVVVSEARGDVPLISISNDGSTLLIPSEDAVEFWRPAAGTPVPFPAPDGVEGVPTSFALSPNGACAAGTWDLEGDAIETVLLPYGEGEPIALPDAVVGGWVASADE